MKILFADDDARLHVIVRMWLSKNGHQVESATNGQDALEQLKSQPYDALITDVNMPLMDGIELVNATLQLPQPPELIVVLTSRCDIAQLQNKVNLTDVHLFNKPFSPKALAELIQKLEKKKQHCHE